MKNIYFNFLAFLLFVTLGTNAIGQTPDNWSLTTDAISISQETTTVNSGSYSCAITWTSQSNQELISDSVVVTENDSVFASISFYDNDAAGRARLCIIFNDGTNTYPNDTYSSDGTSWETVSYKGVVPEGATKAIIKIRFYDVSSDWDDDATVYVDDADLNINHGTNLISNPGFETWSASTDETAPVITWDPADGDTEVDTTTSITISFSEAIRNIDDSEITNDNVSSLIAFKATDKDGADSAFTATISDDKTLITITPTYGLTSDQAYWLTISSVEDESDNAAEADTIVFTTLSGNILFSDDFEDGTLDKWQTYIVTGDTNWYTSSYSGNYFAKASGYISGTGNTETEMWLIADSIDMSVTNNKKLSFYTAANYKGADLQVKYSTNYVNDAAPSTATWTDLTDYALSSTSSYYTWTYSGDIDLSSINSTNFSIAFVYTSNTDSATTYELDNVIIEKTTDESASTEITDFSFENEISTTITSLTGKINSILPYGTDITSLIPTITIPDGATISPESGIAQDFSDSVKYVVTAADGVNTQDWWVYVATPIAASIYDIQYTTDESGNSPYLDSLIQTSGTVTSVGSNCFFMQDSAKAWNGVYVYIKGADVADVAEGDSILIIGTVSEYYNLTEIKDCKSINIISSDKTAPDPVVISATDFDEAYEGVLALIKNVTCTGELDSNDEWDAEDSDGNSIAVGDLFYTYTPTLGFLYDSITGPITYSYSEFKIEPRYESDIVTSSTLSHNAYLSSISISDIAIEDFDSATFSYNDTIAAGTIIIPAVTYTLADEAATAVYTKASDLPGTTTIVVTAEDDTTIKTYTINFILEEESSVSQNEVNAIKFYPTPVSNELIVENLDNTDRLQILNITGSVIYDEVVSGSGATTINTQSWNSGIYLIRTISGNTINSYKLIKQ